MPAVGAAPRQYSCSTGTERPHLHPSGQPPVQGTQMDCCRGAVSQGDSPQCQQSTGGLQLRLCAHDAAERLARHAAVCQVCRLADHQQDTPRQEFPQHGRHHAEPSGVCQGNRMLQDGAAQQSSGQRDPLQPGALQASAEESEEPAEPKQEQERQRQEQQGQEQAEQEE